MSWERFGYICRKVRSTIQDGESISEGISRVEREPGGELYGASLGLNSLPQTLLRDMARVDNRERALAALAVYSKMETPQQLSEPMQFKRVTAYLSYVVFVFFVVSGVYQLKVAPSFIDTFAAFGLSTPSQLVFYREFGWAVSLLISVFLLSGLLIGFALRRLFRFKQGQESGFVIRFLAFGGIRRSYVNVVSAMSFPASDVFLKQGTPETEIEHHLAAAVASDLCLAKEIQELVKSQMHILLHRCEMQMKLISASVAIVVVAAIFFFLVSAYSPLFILGDAV